MMINILYSPKKMGKPSSMCTLTFFLIFLSLSVSVSNAKIIIDHTCTDISKIPDYWIQQVRNMVLLHTGQSHGRQVPYGLANLEVIDNKYGVNISTSGIPPDTGKLRVSRALRSKYDSWIPSVDTTVFWDGDDAINNVRRTLDYHAANGNNVDVILHTWSWDFVTPEYSEGFDKVNRYLVAMETLEAEYPNVTFIYMTDTQDRTGDQGYNVLLNHELIRQNARENDKVLFDYGELETWSADGTVQNTYYHNGSGLTIPVWHSDWAVSDSGYDGGEGGCHINEAGTVMKAKAMWVLLARLAGWDGCEAVYGDITGDCKVNMEDLNVLGKYWRGESCSLEENNWCEGADYNQDGMVDLRDLSVLIGAWLNHPS